MTTPTTIAKCTPLLDKIRFPTDLRLLKEDELRSVASELRADLLDIVSKTGGHLGAGLGVVELTIALHYVFDTPRDKLIWDVGHQSYPHKILTGRRERMRTVRLEGGPSGFAKRSESDFDCFGAGHSSTSISAGLGMAVARDLVGGNNNVVAVIGDGAMSAGMAFEAMNNAGALNSRLIVILNDNDMSISPPTGALRNHLAQLAAAKADVRVSSPKDRRDGLTMKVAPDSLGGAADQAYSCVPDSTLFEKLGFRYVGPIDGHSFNELLPTLKQVRDARDGPVLIHVLTEKGKGYRPAELSRDKFHGVSKFDVETGEQAKSKPNAPSYTEVFAKSLIIEAHEDERIVAVNAAMPNGTGLDLFGEVFPARTFDVGIAEQHAVTFSAGLAAEGLRPFCAIYSTFLQRAYDQIVHDVAIQRLPVRFAIDRAGFVGPDGPTHAGSFDTVFLSALPEMVVMAASDEAELRHMVRTAADYDAGPISFRYPRGNGVGVEVPDRGELIPIGKGRVVREGNSVAILSFGSRLHDALLAAAELDGLGVSTTVADARFAKPLDMDLVSRLAYSHQLLVLLEEGARGGFGAHVLESIARAGLLDRKVSVRCLTMPDRFMAQATPDVLLRSSGLDNSGIVDAVLEALGRDAVGAWRQRRAHQ